MSIKVGLILYSVREEMAKDPIATVEKVGKLGYHFVETCNHNAINDPGCGFGIPAEELKSTFEKFGTRVISTHIFPLEKADLNEVIRYNHIVGNTNLVNPMGQFSTYDDLMKQCEEFNRIGRRLREDGITFLYHNHEFEFRTIRGKMIMDYLMENTDPEYLSFELDTFWTMRGGIDVIEFMKHMGRRIRLLHQKDFAWDSCQEINLIGLTPEERELKEGEIVGMNGNSSYAKNGGKSVVSQSEAEEEYRRRRRTSFTEIGDGIMRIQDIIDAAPEYTDAEYIILEQDFTRLPTQFDSIARSMEAFRKFHGIDWG